ncbi:hypothetical protein HNP69_002825 [Chryseobacterium koreense]|nr:hypothetical protein [Chryseobacterium koreense]
MRLKHIPTGLIGDFVKEVPSKEFKPWVTWIIRLDNGREYFAPKNEFTIVV